MEKRPPSSSPLHRGPMQRTIFASTELSKETVGRLCSDQSVRVLGRVCGASSWFLSCSFETESALLNFGRGYEFRQTRTWESFDAVKVGVQPQCWRHESWVLLRDPKARSPREFMRWTKEAEDPRWIAPEVHRVGFEYSHIVRLCTRSLVDLDEFLRRCRSEGMATTTMCVLFTEKTDLNLNRPSDEELFSIRGDLDYVVTRLLKAEPTTIEEPIDVQVSRLRKMLVQAETDATEDEVRSRLLEPEPASVPSPARLVHPNPLVDRYSIRLNRRGWARALVFIQAVRDGRAKDQLEANLCKDLLGAGPTFFARKIYHMSGAFDFLLPVTAHTEEEISKTVRQFQTSNKGLVEDVSVSLATREPGARGEPLPALDLALVRALATNSTLLGGLKKRLKDRSPIIRASAA